MPVLGLGVWQLATCASAARGLDKSLKRLGFDCVDLYLIRRPIRVVTARSWRQLQELRERGLAREVDVSNFASARSSGYGSAARRSYRPSPDRVQPVPLPAAAARVLPAPRIVFEAYSPLARGRVTDPPIVAIAERLGRTPAQVMGL
jgi:diketogulonate reductase-like aldo/keto reductase